MQVSKIIVKVIGFGFVIAGIILRVAGVSVAGNNSFRGRSFSNVLDGKALILFGLVFLVISYWKPKAKTEE
jgi:sulfite exporter TauE/SafE